MKPIFACLCLAAGAGGAAAQEAAPRVRYEFAPMELQLDAVGRVSALSGEMDPFIPVDYEDVFGTGLGVAVEGALLFDLRDVHVGPYLSVGWDTWEGERDTDIFGDSLEPEDLDAFTVLAGVKGQWRLHPLFHVDAHAGIGSVSWSDTDAVLTLSGVSSEVRLFDRSTRFAFDFGLRAGVGNDRLFAELGLGFRAMGHPRDGDLDLLLDDPAAVAFEFGAGVRF